MSANHAAKLLVKACQDEENLKQRLLNNFVPRDLTSLKSEKISVWNVKDWRMKTILPFQVYLCLFTVLPRSRAISVSICTLTLSRFNQYFLFKSWRFIWSELIRWTDVCYQCWAINASSLNIKLNKFYWTLQKFSYYDALCNPRTRYQQ